MTPDLDSNSVAKILQIFLQPYFANPYNCQAKIQSNSIVIENSNSTQTFDQTPTSTQTLNSNTLNS